MINELPDILDKSPKLTDPVEVPDAIALEHTSTESDALKADIPLANAALQAVHLSWGVVKSVAGVERLLKMTVMATKHRRDVLGIPYGAKANSEAKSGVVFPLD